MASEFRMQRLVEFADTDMAGILHFAAYFRYMEACEHAFFRSLGFSVHPHEQDGLWGWVRADASCRFRRPLRYEDVVELHLRVVRKTHRSLTHEIAFLHEGEEAARGRLVTVPCTRRDGRLRAIPIPPDIARTIVPAPLSREL